MTPDELAHLHQLCFKTPRPWSRAEFSDLLDSKHVFLITHQQGFALGRLAGPEAELLTLAVHPNARRTGVGTVLMEMFEKTAVQHNVQQLFLEVSENNTAAIELYCRAGYQDAGYRKDYYIDATGEKSSANVMTRTLKNG
ncbi:MAG: ribosomal-protein-alanine N-acetyltransferase [Paracoccaceae bacterium]|jgi:ribosomal-protein-alanine N-acetyltransferase